MDSVKQALDGLLGLLLLPATVFGAGGAALNAARRGKGWKQIVLEGIGGVFIANMLGPIIDAHAPEGWAYTLFFLAGWGGLEGVGRIYEAAAGALETRIANHGRHSRDKGVPARKNTKDGEAAGPACDASREGD